MTNVSLCYMPMKSHEDGQDHREKLNEQIAQSGLMVLGGKTTPQILLRWALDQGVTVIPGTSKPEHMKANLNIVDFSLRSGSSAVEGAGAISDAADLFQLVDSRDEKKIYEHEPELIV